MKIARVPAGSGVLVWLAADECEIYRRLVEDAEQAGFGPAAMRHGPDYISISLTLGKRINELFGPSIVQRLTRHLRGN